MSQSAAKAEANKQKRWFLSQSKTRGSNNEAVPLQVSGNYGGEKVMDVDPHRILLIFAPKALLPKDATVAPRVLPNS